MTVLLLLGAVSGATAAERRCVDDADADGLDDRDEVALGTDPGAPDTDGGGALDGVEVHLLATDPLFGLDDRPDTDADGDRAVDRVELAGGDEVGCSGDETDPLAPDTDGDGLLDGADLYPLDPALPGPESFTPSCAPVGRDVTDPEFDDDDHLVSWQAADDRGPRVWVAPVDPLTGGLGAATDLGSTTPLLAVRNGPEWVQGGAPELLFARTEDGQAHPVLFHATPDGGGGWDVGPLPGSPLGACPFGIRYGGTTWVRWSVLDPLDPRSAARRHLFAGTVPTSGLPWHLGLGIGPHRFDETEPAVVLVRPVDGVPQVLRRGLAGVAAGRETALTVGGPGKEQAMVWRDPALGRPLLLTTHQGGRGHPHAVAVYEVGAPEAPMFVVPSPLALPYAHSPEVLVFEGRSYVTWLASAQPPALAAEHGWSGPAEVWLARIDPGGATLARQLGSPDAGRPQDPEPHGGAETAWVYFADPNQVLRRCETGL